jgi:hypothetical protein
MGVSQKFFLQTFGAFFVGNVKPSIKLSTACGKVRSRFVRSVKSTRRVISKKVVYFSTIQDGIPCRVQ